MTKKPRIKNTHNFGFSLVSNKKVACQTALSAWRKLEAVSVMMIHQRYDVFNSLFNYYCMISHSVNDLDKNQLPRHSSLTNENRDLTVSVWGNIDT